MESLSRKADIRRSTLSTWRLNLLKNPTWRPRRSHYALAKRIFSDAQEDELAQRIAATYLSQGLFYSDADFKIDALRFYQETIYQDEGADGELTDQEMEAISKFTASSTFIRDFRYRNRISLRRPSFKRRRKVTNAEMDKFIHEVRQLMRVYPRERIVNIDETNWKAVPGGFLTWAHKGIECVHCQIENDEKQGVTVIAAVDANGRKLPLTVVGKGKTQCCLAGYELPAEVRSCVSESGWTTNDVMCRYFSFLRGELFPDGPIVLVLDVYAAHRSRAVREIAELWGIKLVFIPPGCTDKLQPLDRRVFGVLKAYTRQLWRQQYHASHGAKTTRPIIAANLCQAWHRITEEIIQDAWALYDEGEDWQDLNDEDNAIEAEELNDALGFAESLIRQED
jgi:hypothetical protein